MSDFLQPTPSISAFQTGRIDKPAPLAVVLADDLTGACDSGIEFATRGLLTRVGLGRLPTEPADVFVMSANTRNLDSAQARARVLPLIQSIPADSALIFRKIDSTLRGNIASECDVMLEVLKCPFGVLAPSLPAQGRTVNQGVLHVRDITGTMALKIAEWMERQGSTVTHLPAFSGSGDLHDAIERAATEGARYILCDATTDRDLEVIAGAIHACDSRPLWIGSSGLAAQAARIVAKGRAAGALASKWKMSESPVLYCIGSDHPVTSLQVAHLRGACGLLELDAAWATPKQLHSTLRQNRVALLRIGSDPVTTEQLQALFLASVHAGLARVLMTGGDTAEMLCRAAGVDHIVLTGELSPGVAEGIIQGGLLHGLCIATKSGGFGAEDCLTRTALASSEESQAARKDHE